MARKKGARWNATLPAWFIVPVREAGIMAAPHIPGRVGQLRGNNEAGAWSHSKWVQMDFASRYLFAKGQMLQPMRR